MKQKFLLLFFFFAVPYFVQAQLQDSHFYKVPDSEISSDLKLQGFWKSHVEASLFKNQDSSKKLMKIKMFGRLNLEFTDYLSARFEPYLIFKEGEEQERFADNSENSILEMHQGFFDIKPFNRVSIQLGVLNQEYLNAPLLVSDRPFLSALLAYMYIQDQYEIQFVLEQSMPSIINSFKKYDEIAKIPLFSSVFAYTEWIPSPFYSFKSHLTGFYFSPLPAMIAHQSRINGNTVHNVKSSAEFVYSYYGFNFDFSSQFRITPQMYISFGYNGLLNLGSPIEKGFGERVYANLDIDYFKYTKFYSQIEYFHNRSDSAPAYFNDEIYGHNNRTGFLVEIKAFFPKKNFEVGLRYSLSTPINDDFFLSPSAEKHRQNFFMLFVGSRYLAI